MSYLSRDEFIEICYNNEFDVKEISKALIKLGKSPTTARPGKIQSRIDNYRRKGLLPLASGNQAESALPVKSISTLYDSTGKVKSQRVTSANHTNKGTLDVIKQAITDLAESLPVQPLVTPPTVHLDEHLTNVVVSNDLHFGLLVDKDDSTEDWNTSSIVTRVHEAYDYLFSCMPRAKYCVITDLGDLLEAENNMRTTRRSGNILDTDGKYANHFRAAYEALIYAINKALETHEIVYFYNVHGNHEESESAMSIREVIRVAFLDNPRVIVNTTGHSIKYHHFGQVLLQFFHGHALKMRQAPEVMAHDMQSIFSSTKFRYGLSGHVHKDSVYDSPIARIESFRTIIPNNTYAFDHGYRTNCGSMNCITYHAEQGEISRNTYNVQ